MRQGNDRGTQYRSAIYWTTEAQKNLAEQSLATYQLQVNEGRNLEITTEIAEAKTFYYAEEYHQQYLCKNPNGYCNMQSVDKTGLPTPSICRQ
jgi:peptide-methionine (S)-S-oxide reductase